MIKVGSYTTSRIEIRELLKAWLAISIAFSIVMGKGFGLGFIDVFMISALTVGIGFLLHELGHKIVAQRYGCYAEFRSFNKWLFLMIIMSFFGIIFAAPGAVFISGPVGIRRNGKISVAGPIVNLFLVILFFSVVIFLQPTGILSLIASFGIRINGWLALFNMIPFGPLDGKKILAWSKPVYWVVLVIAFVFTFFSSFVLGLFQFS